MSTNTKEKLPKYLDLISQSAEDKAKSNLEFHNKKAHNSILSAINANELKIMEIDEEIRRLTGSLHFNPTEIVERIGEKKKYELGLEELKKLEKERF